jgi:hypothetical protein
MVLKVRCESTRALEDILHRLYNIKGVIRTQSYIVLNTYLERGPGESGDPERLGAARAPSRGRPRVTRANAAARSLKTRSNGHVRIAGRATMT